MQIYCCSSALTGAGNRKQLRYWYFSFLRIHKRKRILSDREHKRITSLGNFKTPMFLKYVVPKDNKSRLILFWKLEGVGWEYFEHGSVHSFLVHVHAPMMHTQRDHCSQHVPNSYLTITESQGQSLMLRQRKRKPYKHCTEIPWHQTRNISRLFLLIEGCLGDHSENILFFYVLTVFWLRDFWRPDFLGTFFL